MEKRDFMFKKLLPHIVAVVLFYTLCAVFFYPAMQGKQLIQTDIINSRAMLGEEIYYKKQTGDIYYWNNSMFAGMPWRQLTLGKENNLTRVLAFPMTKVGLPRIAGYLFLGMLFTYLVLVLLKVNPWLSMVGAVAFSFNM